MAMSSDMAFSKAALHAMCARQRPHILLLVVAPGQLDDRAPRLAEQLLAISVRRDQRAIARQRQSQRFRQAVHRIGRKHARA